MIPTPEEARDLIVKLGATPPLLKHIDLVMEAAEALLDRFAFLRIPVKCDAVRVGVIFHDVGKIWHPEELAGGGNLHEEAGKAILLSHGIPIDIANVCVSHSRWLEATQIVFWEMIVALADRLWKGRRDPELELAIINAAAGYDAYWGRWDLFIPCLSGQLPNVLGPLARSPTPTRGARLVTTPQPDGNLARLNKSSRRAAKRDQWLNDHLQLWPLSRRSCSLRSMESPMSFGASGYGSPT